MTFSIMTPETVMLNVANKPFVLNVIILCAVMLNVVEPYQQSTCWLKQNVLNNSSKFIQIHQLNSLHTCTVVYRLFINMECLWSQLVLLLKEVQLLTVLASSEELLGVMFFCKTAYLSGFSNLLGLSCLAMGKYL